MCTFRCLIIWFVLNWLVISGYSSRIAIEITLKNVSGVSNRHYRYAFKPQYGNFLPNNSNPPIIRRYEHLTGPRVVGGREAKAGEFPYQVSFKTAARKFNVWMNFCGGSVLKPKTVLTAAHCFEHLRPFSTCSPTFRLKHSTYAVAGCLLSQVRNPPVLLDSVKWGQWRKVNMVTMHENYNFPNYDVAVVFIKGSFKYNDYVKPVPLASNADTDYTDCTISGFGDSDPGKKMIMHPYLLTAKLAVLSRQICTWFFRSDRKQFICTNDMAGTASGKGDSGGPLLCRDAADPKDQGKGVLAGIVCGGAGSISLFTRVASHLDFITTNGAESVIPSLFVLLAKVLVSVFL